MKFQKSNRPFFLLSLLLLSFQFLNAQDLSMLVSPFQGSTVLGTYQSRFAPLTLLTGPLDAKQMPVTVAVEGALSSKIYTRPEGVSEFEVYSSYKKVLASADFDLLLDCESAMLNKRQNRFMVTLIKK